jgi:hypothetical protein
MEYVNPSKTMMECHLPIETIAGAEFLKSLDSMSLVADLRQKAIGLIKWKMAQFISGGEVDIPRE